jgi:hypothetical protein
MNIRALKFPVHLKEIACRDRVNPALRLCRLNRVTSSSFILGPHAQSLIPHIQSRNGAERWRSLHGHGQGYHRATSLPVVMVVKTSPSCCSAVVCRAFSVFTSDTAVAKSNFVKQVAHRPHNESRPQAVFRGHNKPLLTVGCTTTSFTAKNTGGEMSVLTSERVRPNYTSGLF